MSNRFVKEIYRAADMYQLATYASKLAVPGMLVHPGPVDESDSFKLGALDLHVCTVDVARALRERRLRLPVVA